MSANRDIDYEVCNATIDLGGRGIHLCFLHRGHSGSHRANELMIALGKRGALVEQFAPGSPHAQKWDGNLGGGQWVPLKIHQDKLKEQMANTIAWQMQAEKAADACTLALGERDVARHFAEEAVEKYNKLLVEKRVLRCAFCNFEYPEGTPPTQHEALTQHIRECQAHPYRMELAGLRWEVSHCRELLRHIVAVAYKGRLSNEMELVLSSVNNYLAGLPQSENES